MTQNVNMDYIGLMFLSLLIFSSPSEERKHQSISPWSFKEAESLEWVEWLKSMLKWGSRTFALNSLHSSPFPPLHCNWPTESWWYIFNTTVSHPQRLQTMAFLTYNGPQSCSLLVATHTWYHQRGHGCERIWLSVMTCSKETQLWHRFTQWFVQPPYDIHREV